MKHHLTLVDRGVAHVHRWTPRCSCGWTGRHRRRQQEAVAQYRQHRDARMLLGRFGPTPRPLTPADQLPVELRGGAM